MGFARRRRLRLINGGRMCSEKHRIGYCWSDLHPGFLTKGLMAQHQCVEKECVFFEKFKDCSYWIHKEKEKALKSKSSDLRAEKALRSRNANFLLARFRELTKDIEGFGVAGVEYKDGVYMARFVAVRFVDVSYLKECASKLGSELGLVVRFYFIKNTPDIRFKILKQLKTLDS